MKSSTSHRAGSSRTFLNTMYFTSGAYVITRRLRTPRSPVALYSRHSASASSAETRRRLPVDEVGFIVRNCAPENGGTVKRTKGVSGADPMSLITDLG